MLLFQGMWVGLTEEMAMRPALQLPLSLRLTGKVRVWRWELSHALLWTALAFGLLHMPNVFLGQSLTATIGQSLFAAVVGAFFGDYYERTDNYLGAAMLHNVLDVCGYLAVLIMLALWQTCTRRRHPRMPLEIYFAGPLFQPCERDWISAQARRLRAAGYEVFVPHEQPLPTPLTPEVVFAGDLIGLKEADVLLAVLDGV